MFTSPLRIAPRRYGYSLINIVSCGEKPRIKWKSFTKVASVKRCDTLFPAFCLPRVIFEHHADRHMFRLVVLLCSSIVLQVQRLSWFANWYDSLEEPPTAIIDGPNAALMNQNYESGGFTLRQVRCTSFVVRKVTISYGSFV